MNALQRYNHAILRKHIFSPRIVKSLNILPNGVIKLDDLEWQDYWDGCPLQSLLDKLFVSWHGWISSWFDRVKLNCYVYDYFCLLEAGLVAYQSGEIDLRFLNKIVAFETFLVCTQNDQNHAASLFSTRNPNYLLHKIPSPNATDNPKYLPIICQSEQLGQTSRMYYHYRRIPVKHSRATQLFVYPPVALADQECSSFSVIDLLFRVLTNYNDPWIKWRCTILAKSVFNDLIVSLNKPKINLLDLGCGSGKISMQLCAQAHNTTKSSFDLSLVDTIPSRFSIARLFYKNYRAFEAIRYRRNDLLGWVSNMRNDPATYDIALMLRVYDTLCRYQAGSIPLEHILSLLKLPDDNTVLHTPISQQILDSPDKIVHSLHKIRTQCGSAYFQPALQDFFKSLFFCCDINYNNNTNKEIVFPVRSFSEDSLVMQDGTSMIKQIMDKSQYLIIEDSDVSLELLCSHAKKRQLDHLSFTHKRSSQHSHCILVSHSNH